MILLVNPSIAQVIDSTKSKIQQPTTNNQQPTSNNQQPKSNIQHPTSTYHSPKKAALFSAALPGLGQAYNKKYWKIPVIYAGAAGLTYFISFEQSNYVKYRTAYKYRIDNDPATIDDYVGLYSDESLNSLQTFYHRYRDLSVIAATTLYLLNIIDASVDAHMFTFDVSDDLSFHLHPAIMNIAHTNQFTTGLSLTIKL